MRDALAGMDAQTFYGRIKFNEGGQNIGSPVVIEQIMDGKVVTVFPTSVATSKADYPLK